MKLSTHKIYIAIFIYSLWMNYAACAQVETDNLFYQHSENLIYENSFDSAEILLRNKLTENKISDSTYFYCHLLLAKMYMKLNDRVTWQKEINFCRSVVSLKISNQLKRNYYLELCQDYFTLQIYDSANYYSSLYLSTTLAIQNKNDAIAKIINGYCYYLKGEYNLAEKNYFDVAQYYISSHTTCELPLVYSKLALLRARQNNIEEAFAYLIQSSNIADSCNNKQYKKITLNALNDVHIQNSDYKQAYETLIKINSLNVEIDKDIQNQQLTGIRERYNNREREKKFLIIEKDNSNKNSVLKYLYFLIAFLILFIGLLYFYYQKYKRANRFIHQQSSQLQEQNAIIKDSLNQREFLYRELNHRIKNNLQLITSMLNLQDRYSHYSSYKELIGEITQKINTIALTYAKMFVDGRKTNDIINLKDYITDISNNVLNSLSAGNIVLNIDAKPVSTNLDIAIPLGLITNEIITNSIKHAFENTPNPQITIVLNENNDNIYYAIGDNGVGINNNFSLESANSLGSKIIYLLSQQIKSDLHIDNTHGTNYSFQINNLKTVQYENINL